MAKKLSFLIIVLSLIIFSGCQIPFSQEARMSSYLSRVKTITNQTKAGLDRLDSNLETDSFSKEKLESNVNLLNETIEKEQGRYQTIKDLNPPQTANDLDSYLNKYYRKELKALTDSRDLYQYLSQTQQYWNEDQPYLTKLENLDYSNSSQLENKLDRLAKQSRESYKKLKTVQPTNIASGYHDQLLKLNKGIADFFDQIAQAVNDQDTTQVDIATDQLEEIASSASNAFTDLEIGNKFGNYSKDLSSLWDKINSQIKALEQEN